MLVLAFFFLEGAEQAVGVADGGWLVLVRSPLGGTGCRRRTQIQGLEELGRDPSRRAIAEGASSSATPFKA